MTLALISLHFWPIRWGSRPDRQPPIPPHPSPQRLMKKTSAGVEKVARPVYCDLAMSLFSIWQVLMRQGWLVSQPGSEDGQDGPILQHHFTCSLGRQPFFPPSSPLNLLLTLPSHSLNPCHSVAIITIKTFFCAILIRIQLLNVERYKMPFTLHDEPLWD